MASTFPQQLDQFINPSGSTILGTDVYPLKHSVQHQNLNDAVAAVEAHIGVSGSIVSGTVNYRLDHLTNDVLELKTNQSQSFNPRQILLLAEQGPFEGFGSSEYFKENVYSGFIISSQIWYSDVAKTKKIFEIEYKDRNKTNQAETMVYTLYKSDGLNIETKAEDIITYNGPREISRLRRML
jgi:hypothetical protein